MERDQQAAPLPSDPPGREDIMSDEQREEEFNPVSRESVPLPRDPAVPEDVLRTDSQNDPLADG